MDNRIWKNSLKDLITCLESGENIVYQTHKVKDKLYIVKAGCSDYKFLANVRRWTSETEMMRELVSERKALMRKLQGVRLSRKRILEKEKKKEKVKPKDDSLKNNKKIEIHLCKKEEPLDFSSKMPEVLSLRFAEALKQLKDNKDKLIFCEAKLSNFKQYSFLFNEDVPVDFVKYFISEIRKGHFKKEDDFIRRAKEKNIFIKRMKNKNIFIFSKENICVGKMKIVLCYKII